MKLRRPWIATLFGCACICGGAAIDAMGRDGLGPIPTGRGGVNQAFNDNAEMILDNPSSMVNVEGDGLIELGVATAITTSSYSDSFGNDVDSAVRPQPGPVLGITKKMPDGQWAFGLGLFAPSSFGAGYGELSNPTFGSSSMRSRADLIKLLPAMAYRVTDRLAVGLNFGVGLSYASLNGPQYLQNGPLTGVPALLDSRGTGAAPVGAVGMQYRLTDKTKFGATYTEQSSFWLRGATNATFFDGSIVESRFNSKMRLCWPRTVAFGIKHELCPHRRFGIDALWTDWAHAFDDVNLVMYSPDNSAVQSMLAAAGGSLPIKQKIPLRWMETVAFRFGYEMDLGENDVLRFGYDYDPNPAPDSTFSPYFGGGRQHDFSIGFSRKLRRTIFNAAYQYAFGPTRHIGASALVGGQFDNSTYRADAHYVTMSLSIPY